ncbi:ubiquitin fusion degradation protein [Scheffersomyces stipitis CBS 6054]|uniref:Ubiquitin fusion degradation protein n=1 Tax=Scheffersomyces stipitis (strain ATCC 58785 / CBS 6054 / NBRC 10063 / NRRL Y-11545) TaxID=322104 RepID=A3LY47_PICST|nr:ubiquitin fusion degradation protein [Scheffersomyces stipitis CBS 6054]ABN67917.2 ubiquitin fusion degradation protein [Scheffersomyces stipitis CBS 6054]KAG2732283.1 hypothetical protein G9P44_004700 [Scheffersomyces stipitis]
MYIPPFQLRVLPATSQLPSYSDKAILPASVLSRIVDIIPESELPHPLIFKITSSESLGSCYIGVREFSAPEDETVVLPDWIFTKLLEPESVTVELQLKSSISKATSLKLKPLQLYSNITNWKYFLENKLTQYYTTLTSKETLVIEDDNLRYELYIEEINGEAHKPVTASIIDTDIVLDVVPLNDKLASEQQLEFNSNPHNNIVEIESVVEATVHSFLSPKFKPTIYKIDLSKYDSELFIKLDNLAFASSNFDAIFNVDVIAGLDKFVSLENFKYTTMDEDFLLQNRFQHGNTSKATKVIRVDLKDDDILNKLQRAKDESVDGIDDLEKFLYLIPFSWDEEAEVTLTISTCISDILEDNNADIVDTEVPEGHSRCPNCLKLISSNKLVLHESFCLRNNVKCTKCDMVFLKEIPSSHWHCDVCVDFHSDSSLLKFKHTRLYHTNQAYKCNQCSSTEEYGTFIELVTKHKATVCPSKLHQCRFCHLIVPQGQATYQDRFENLTNHENSCGNKTIECYKCNKVFRTKDFQKHLKMHDLDKIQFNEWNKTVFRKCSNVNCIKLLGTEAANDLDLCDLCYGPLYIAQHDPTHIKLQQRIERRYMMQLTKGCGNGWCRNPYCASSYNASAEIKGKPFKELIQLLNEFLFRQISTPSFPINKAHVVEGRNRLWFCVNESVSNKNVMLELISSEGEYDEEIIYKAVNEKNDEQSMRSWLHDNAIKV